jgi:TRAP-type C4-dicarboxylate transport system substrate-binding protein
MLKQTIVALGVASSLGAAATANADYPNMSLQLAHPLPQTWPAAEWDSWWAEEVERRSDGNISVQIFWSGQIAGLTEVKTLVSTGGVNLGVFAQAVHASDMPLASIGGGLLNMVSGNARAASELAGDTYAASTTQEEFERLGLVPIKWTVPSPYRLQCNKPIEKTDDLKGLRVRAVGGAFVPIWMESLGMVPVRVQATEIREGLQRGTLDCNFGPIEWSTFFDLHQVAPYLSDINTGSFTTFQLYANRDAFTSWPENVQKLFLEVGREAMERDLAQLGEVEQESIEKFKDAGGEIVELQDPETLMERAPDMVDAWIERMRSDGLADEIEPIIPLQREAQNSFTSPTL